MTITRFSFPTTIHFGPGARKLVADHLKAEGIARPLIVTDRGIAPLPLLADFVATLTGLDVAVYSEIWGNPVRSQVKQGAAAYKAHNADAVIGLGGGAALDVAKAIALMASHPGDILEYAWDHPEVRPIGRPLPYFVALPTTAGTGSEVGRSAVVSDDTTHIKKIIFSPALLAKCVFADPELTFDLPPAITAATGMDALTHNVESYLSPEYHPLCDGIALEGVRIAARALPIAFRDGRNLAARSDMLMSSMMGAIAFQKDLGAVHSLRARAVHGGRSPPRPRQRDHDRPRDALQPAGGEREDGRARARGRRRRRRRDGRAGGRQGLHRVAGEDEGRPRHSGDALRDDRAATRDARRHSGAGRRGDQRHLSQDQSAPVHARGLRADVRGCDLTSCMSARPPLPFDSRLNS